ncbi:MAG TPA: ATP-binding protein [Beijerinckiaceae bacterium]|nr:ATP-binding protein [Beijerinckiaceae bacterium]
MPRPRERSSESPPTAAGARRAGAAIGALTAATALLAFAAWRGGLDWPVVAIAALAVGAAVLIGGRDRAPPSAGPAALPQERPAAPDRLLDQIPEPVILVDRLVVVRLANEAASALFPALRIDQPLSFALRAPDVLDGIAGALSTGLPARLEYDERVPVERSFEVRIGPLAPPDAALLFFRDLTAARRLEHMRVDFVANASHEVRTPLASLLGFIETLQGPARDDPAAREKFLEIMRGQALRMTRLIEDLLSLSRVELKAHLRPDTPLDLAAIVRQMVDTLAPLAREHGVEIALAVGEKPHIVLGDRDELLRAVENLIDNAVKYGEAGKRVEVALRRLDRGDGRPSEFELAVRDHGPGIPPEHLPRLTERFYRADVVESRQKGGTGLGLAIVKHIVARHRGRLAIESEPGEGATFRIALPEAPPERRQAAV